MGRVAHEAGEVGAEEAAEAADGGDGGDGSGGGGPTDHARSERPEGAHGAPQADGDQRHGDERDGDVAGAGGAGEAGGGQHHASGDMPAAFIRAVGGAADDDGEDCCQKIGQRGVAGDEACTGGRGAGAREAAEDQRHPEIDDVDADLDDDVDGGEQPDGGQAEGVQQIVMHGCAVAGLVARQLALEPLLLGGRHPGDLVGRVLQNEKNGDAEQDGGHAFQQEEPLPSAEAAQAVEPQQCAGQRRADHAGQRGRGHELGDGTRPLVRWEPEGEVEQHAGHKTGLGHAQQKAQQVEGVR